MLFTVMLSRVLQLLICLCHWFMCEHFQHLSKSDFVANYTGILLLVLFYLNEYFLCEGTGIRFLIALPNGFLVVYFFFGGGSKPHHTPSSCFDSGFNHVCQKNTKDCVLVFLTRLTSVDKFLNFTIQFK